MRITAAEDHQFGGGLAEIGNAVVRHEAAGLGPQQVHGSGAQGLAQARFERGSVQRLADQHQAGDTRLVGAPGAVEVLVETGAHPWISRRIGLPGMAAKPLARKMPNSTTS